MKAWAAIFLALLPVGFALAQRPLTEAAPAELIERLQPTPALTRSLRNLRPEPRSVDLAVQFDFDSAALSPTSRALLGNLAQAMNADQLKGVAFRIEGHTDAKGSEGYNQKLSMRRAEAVTADLVERGVEASRLAPEGLGARSLLLPTQPFAAANRRVRIVAVPGDQN
jgi:outer membrane protein OmpA-like peptidoglycan-associated protein